MAHTFFIRPDLVHESRFVLSLLFPAVFALMQDGNQLFINSYLGKSCGGGNNNKIVFFFFSFFLHTWLFIDDASFDHDCYTRTSEVEVYYLKGVIGLPIVISFRDRWYYIFFFGNGLIDDVIVISWTDSDFRISRALVSLHCLWMLNKNTSRKHFDIFCVFLQDKMAWNQRWKEIAEIVEEMKVMNREERGTGMKVKKQKK